MGNLDPRSVQIFDTHGTKIGVMTDLYNAMHAQFLNVSKYDDYLVRAPQQSTFLMIENDLVEILSIRGRFSGKDLEKKPYKNSLTHVFGSLNSGEVYFIDERRDVSSPGDNLTAETEFFDMKAHFPHWFEDDNRVAV